MKKITFCVTLVAGLLLFANQTFAQFEKGDKLLNLGVGLNSHYSGGIPLSASFEVGIDDNISIGGNVDYLSNSYGILGNSYGFTVLYFGARASYHFNKLLDLNSEKIDLYGGASLGYRSFSWSDNYLGANLNDSYGSGIYLAIYAGGKYYVSKSTAIFTELGAVGSTNFRLGVAFKF